MNTSEYAAHPIRNLLERLAELLKSAELSDPDLLAHEQNTTAIESVVALTTSVNQSLESVPAIQVSGHGLLQLQSVLQSIFNELSAFQSNRNPGHLQNAKVQVEQAAMPLLWLFGPQHMAVGNRQLAGAFDDATAIGRAAIQQVVAKRDEVMRHQAALVQQTEDCRVRLEGLSEAIAKQRAEAIAAVSIVQQKSAEKDTERAAAFDTLVKELRSQFAEFQTEAANTQRQRLESLRKSQEEAALIVEVVGNTGITGNYQKIANSEAKAANVWRWITIGFFCVGILVAAATFWKFWNEPFSPETAWSASIRLAYAIAITAPAWYAARESARHRSNADRARQTELELASLGPFIELMPEDRKQQIREELVKRYFGNGIVEHTVEPPITFKQVGNLAIDMMKASRSR